MRDALFLDDLKVGRKFVTQSTTLTLEGCKAFAAEFDPQPFHLDDAAARVSFFAGLAVSGWHTAALSMRLLVESGFRPAGGIIGTRAEELRWPKAVRPGDELEVEAEVVEVRASASRPGHGYVKCRAITRNQHGEPVQVLVMHLLVEARGGRGA